MYKTIRFRSMNTDVCAMLWSRHHESPDLLDHVEQFFDAMHRKFTRFSSDSELSALNASSGKPFRVSDEMMELIVLSVKYHRLTEGLFNPGVKYALEAAGYDRTFDEINNNGTYIRVSGPVPDLNGVIMNKECGTVTLPPELQLDFGGIAKGWSVRQAARMLSSSGPCLVNAGGDIMTFGTVPGTTDWSVNLADPFRAGVNLFKIAVNNAGLATSGINKRKWKTQGLPLHHLINPRTGRPSDSDLETVTVLAPDTVEAEIYAKMIFFLGSADGLRFADRHPRLEACIITQKGEMLLTKRMNRSIMYETV